MYYSFVRMLMYNKKITNNLYIGFIFHLIISYPYFLKVIHSL